MEELFNDYNGVDLPEVPLIIDPKSQVPVIIDFSRERTVEIDFTVYTDRNCMINLINSALSEFDEEIKSICYSDDNCEWRIEYGTKPLEEKATTYILKNILQLGRECSRVAAYVAFKKFGLQMEDITFDRVQPPFKRKLWAEIKIELRYIGWIDKFGIIISRMRGCRNSYHYVSMRINERLNDYKLNHLWNLRKNYLQLLEGLPSQTGRDNVLTYLLNDGIVKAVCELMR